MHKVNATCFLRIHVLQTCWYCSNAYLSVNSIIETQQSTLILISLKDILLCLYIKQSGDKFWYKRTFEPLTVISFITRILCAVGNESLWAKTPMCESKILMYLSASPLTFRLMAVSRPHQSRFDKKHGEYKDILCFFFP